MKGKRASEWYSVANGAEAPELRIYGHIGPYDEVDFNGFRREVENLAKAHRSVTVRINSGGGSVIEGLAIYDCLVGSGMEVSTHIEGMAASMAGVVAQAGRARRMNRNAFIMVHRVSGTGEGDADDLRAQADLVEKCEARVKAIYAQRTGRPAHVVDGWYAKKTDWWITAEEALALGLVDEIVDVGEAATPDAAYYDMITNSIRDMDMDKMRTAILSLLASRGVQSPANATDGQTVASVAAEFRKLDEKISGLKGQLEEKDRERVAGFIEAGKASGQIRDDPKEVADWEELARANHALAVRQLAKVPQTPRNVTVNVGLAGSGTAGVPEDRDKWTFRDWSRNDPRGLRSMRAAEPERFMGLVDGIKKELTEKGAIRQ